VARNGETYTCIFDDHALRGTTTATAPTPARSESSKRALVIIRSIMLKLVTVQVAVGLGRRISGVHLQRSRIYKRHVLGLRNRLHQVANLLRTAIEATAAAV
jgi:hypothetical protein